MAFTPIYGLNVFLTAPTSAGAGILQIDPSSATTLAAKLGSNFTIAAISDGVNYEIIRIDSVTSPNLNVTRGFDGTISSAFPKGACVRFIWTADGITAVAAGVTFTVTGTHQAVVTSTGPNSWNVDVPTPAITGASPIEVLGTYPTLEVTASTTFGGCCCGGGGGGGGGGTITEITGAGLVTITGGTGPTANVSVVAPNFIAGSNMSITGSWPNFTFSASGGGGGGGGVASVTGSAKIVLSGTPTNPVINLVTTGAGGTYNGITFDAWGTITATNSGYVPLTTVTSSNATATITYPTPGTVSIVYGQAGIGPSSDLGLVRLASPTSGATNNATDSTSAVSPAGINAVISSLTGVSFVSSFTYTSDLAATYTNTLGPAVTFGAGVASGHTALITATCEISDSALGAGVSPVFGLAIFNGATLVQGIKSMTASAHTIQFVVPGPISPGTTYILKSTALPGTVSVIAASMVAIVS